MSDGVEIFPLRDVGDERGRTWLPAPALERLGRVADVHVMTLEPGHSRGHHFHRVRNEVLLVEGPARLLWDDGEGTAARERRLAPGEVVAALIPSGCAHAIAGLERGEEGAAEVRAIGFSDIPYDPDRPDTHPRRLGR
jgi:quercetin dioxygenase-like cupin family protein